MATVIPSANVEAAYEDMFKEITRKLYGEETGNGLHTLGTPVAQVATSGPTAPEGERSFTNLVRLPIDRSVAPTIEYEHSTGSGATGNSASGSGQQDTTSTVANAGTFKSEDQLSTAFGLAALMQNGFTTGGTILGTHTIQQKDVNNPSASNANVGGNPGTETRWSTAIPVTVPSGAEDIVQWPTGGKLSSYNGTHKTSKSSKSRDHTPNEIYTSPTSAPNNSTPNGNNSNTPTVVQHSQQHSTTPATGSSNSRKKNSATTATASTVNQQNTQLQIPKRYACTHCPYSTDRRDLYTRHENIHKDEKPFQCYACLKQFNRADHVKKHFLRMHREMVYDINKTRRSVTSTTSTQQPTHQIDQKPNIFLQPQQQVGSAGGGVVHGENFMTSQRQETSTSLSIVQTIESVATAAHTDTIPIMKQEKITNDDIIGAGGIKVKREKRFTCCYCPWSGADKWGLKRHLNTHTKPFVCMLCDYKAARSERLATHVLKVHNKKACNKCSFLADNQEEYQAHMSDVHLLKMDALSRNTASVAQDFHKAGGVDLKTQHHFLNNNLLSKQTALLHEQHEFLNKSNQNHRNNLRSKQKILPTKHVYANGTEDDYENMENVENFHVLKDQKKAMSAFLSRNFGLQEKAQSNSNNRLNNQLLHTELNQHCNGDVKPFSPNRISGNKSNEVPQQQPQNDHEQKEQRKEYKYDQEQHHHNQQQQQLLKSPPAQPINLTSNKNNQKLNSKMNNNNNNIQNGRKITNNNNHKTPIMPGNTQSTYKGHRLDLIRDKENSNSIFSAMEYEHFSKIGTQFQNYVKDIINKYYAETSILFPIVPSQHVQPQQNVQPPIQQQNLQLAAEKRHKLTETEEYIEYLRNKEDITLTITPKNSNKNNSTKNHINGTKITQRDNNYNQQIRPAVIITKAPPALPRLTEEEPKVQVIPVRNHINGNLRNLVNVASACKAVPLALTVNSLHASYPQVPLDMSATSLHSSDTRRSHRKQAQPKKIKIPPEVIMAQLRDKYLRKMVDRKKSCAVCTISSLKAMLVFPYHTRASLLLHRLWKHTERPQTCKNCNKRFTKIYSLKMHRYLKHRK